ncbi:hypothetical protein ANANG_G00215540 [Anguilla anguilla]|uniref:Uncharacterized protein n=1 Tax=Anguilla anguilla TaxID=7936 RepID=A0A9D3RNZ1_ANGAN|nr:hypothetical protein ANANG_G00215540 [Anguilla anguilla]
MMAIAQKCSLSLYPLPDPVPPELMEESSDWGVTMENLKAEPAFEVSPRPDKKRRPKTASEPKASWAENAGTPENVPERSASKRPMNSSHVGPGANEGTERKPKKAAPVLKATPVPEAPRDQTRRELQEALPKIPPLPSFKPRASVVASFEDLVTDYERFMTEGPGRSVEIIRQFTGPRGDDQLCVLESREIVQSQDGCPAGRHSSPAPSWSRSQIIAPSRSRSQIIAPSRSRSQSPAPSRSRSQSPSPSRSRSQSSAPSEAYASSDTAAGSGGVGDPKVPGRADKTRRIEHRERSPSQTSSSSVPGPTEQPSAGQATRCAQILPKPTPQPPPQPHARPKHRPSPQAQKASQAVKRPRGSSAAPVEPRSGAAERRAPRESGGAAAERGHGEYWQACRRAWDLYLAAMPQACHQGHHSAYSWMAAYRMNAVYMEELLRR